MRHVVPGSAYQNSKRLSGHTNGRQKQLKCIIKQMHPPVHEINTPLEVVMKSHNDTDHH